VRNQEHESISFTVQYESLNESHTFIFPDNDLDEVHKSLVNQWNKNRVDENTIAKKKEKEKELSQLQMYMPCKDNWRNIINDCVKFTFNEGDPIIEQGKTYLPFVLYVSQGSINVEKSIDGEVYHLDRSPVDTTFAHMAYLIAGSPFTFNVSAAEDNTIINLIDGNFLDTLFYYDTNLCTKFYFLFAQQICFNLERREKTILECKGGTLNSQKGFQSNLINKSQSHLFDSNLETSQNHDRDK